MLGQIPKIARANVDLPAALGPMIPIIDPAGAEKFTPLTTAAFAPGGATITCSSVMLPSGAGRDIRSGSSAIFASISFKRWYWPRAATNGFQAPIIWSMGPSARPNRIEPAIIRPGEISRCTAR